MNGETDIQANSKKDITFVTVSGLSEAAMKIVRVDAFLDECLSKVQVGVLMPTADVQHDFDHTRCVGEQKLVGF